MRQANPKIIVIFLLPAPASDLLDIDRKAFGLEMKLLLKNDPLSFAVDFPEEGLYYDRGEMSRGIRLHPDKTDRFLENFLKDLICIMAP